METNQVVKIPIADLEESPFQGRMMGKLADPRNPFEKNLKELGDSIAKQGLIQPIIVRPSPKTSGKFEIVDGHRRVRAVSEIIGDPEIDAIVNQFDDRKAQIISFISNILHNNLNLFEQAETIRKFLDNKEYSSIKELAQAIGKDNTYIGDVLNILKMDNRILLDLSKRNKPVDVRILRTIRKMYPLPKKPKREIKDETIGYFEQWRSDQQWEKYKEVKKRIENGEEKVREKLEAEFKGKRIKSDFYWKSGRKSTTLTFGRMFNELEITKIQDFISTNIIQNTIDE